MIPENFVEQWRVNAPWQTLAMIEQDLVISRALVDLYNEPKVFESLVFIGGTALNKLYLNPPSRYSEDIDFVQIKASPIGDTISGIRNALDPWLGEPKRKFTERCAKLIYRYNAVDNTPAKLKIEINTTEHFHVMPLKQIPYSLNSEWHQGNTTLLTYELDELMSTKIRALYQRRKGRDLFDLWLVLNKELINVENVLYILSKYCHENNEFITRKMLEDNLAEKRQHSDFLSDINILLSPENNWDIDNAFELIHKKIISNMR